MWPRSQCLQMAKTVWQPGHRASRAGCFAQSTTARPTRRRHHDRHSRIPQNVRQSGAVELVPRRQGLVHSRARSVYSGSSLASGNGRPEAGLHTPAANSTNAAPRTRRTGRRYAPRLDLRPSAGRVPSGLETLGSGPVGSEGACARWSTRRLSAQISTFLGARLQVGGPSGDRDG